MLCWRYFLRCLYRAHGAPRTIDSSSSTTKLDEHCSRRLPCPTLVLFLVWALVLILILGLDREQFHFKNEGGIRANVGALSAFAVSQIGRNHELPLGPDGHELKGFGPALDHSADRKRRGLAALVGAVKFLAIDERAFVVAGHGVGGAGLWSCARS